MTEWFADSSVEIDPAIMEETKQQHKMMGDDAITAQSIGTTPLMVLVQHLTGIENCHYFLADYTADVEELFEFMQKKILNIAEILAEHSPAEILYLVENTSTTLISPRQFRKYCYQHILQCAKFLTNSGKFFVLHMCGYLKDLLKDLATLPVNGFEAFTSPPVGNTTLVDGRRECPNKCLIGGTNAVLWTKTAQEIITQIEKDLNRLQHHRGIVITSAGVMPPVCKPETIRSVRLWLKTYQIKV